MNKIVQPLRQIYGSIPFYFSFFHRTPHTQKTFHDIVDVAESGKRNFSKRVFHSLQIFIKNSNFSTEEVIFMIVRREFLMEQIYR